jgi:hypothetical protein
MHRLHATIFLVLLATLASVLSFNGLPRMIVNSRFTRPDTGRTISKYPTSLRCSSEEQSNEPPIRTLENPMVQLSCESSKTSLNDLTILASDPNGLDVVELIIDGYNKESLPLIKEIIQKSFSIVISLDAPDIEALLSEISSIPAYKLTLHTKLPANLPSLPYLEHLLLVGNAGYENLSTHLQSFKEVSRMQFLDVDTLVINQRIEDLPNLTDLEFYNCKSVDVSNFHNEALEYVRITGYHEIRLPEIILHESFPGGKILTNKVKYQKDAIDSMRVKEIEEEFEEDVDNLNSGMTFVPTIYSLEAFRKVYGKVRHIYEKDLIAATGSPNMPEDAKIVLWNHYEGLSEE